MLAVAKSGGIIDQESVAVKALVSAICHDGSGGSAGPGANCSNRCLLSVPGLVRFSMPSEKIKILVAVDELQLLINACGYISILIIFILRIRTEIYFQCGSFIRNSLQSFPAII